MTNHLSGEVHLATLDGKLRANWISGCRLKKYHEPLTPKTLQRLHDVKERKIHVKTLKQEALKESKESKERARKLKSYRNLKKNQTIMVCNKKSRIFQLIETDGEKEHLRPYIFVYKRD